MIYTAFSYSFVCFSLSICLSYHRTSAMSFNQQFNVIFMLQWYHGCVAVLLFVFIYV